MDEQTFKNLQYMYADISNCFLAIANALESSGAVSKAHIAEAFQEQLLKVQPTGKVDAEFPASFVLLKQVAVRLQATHNPLLPETEHPTAPE